MLGQINLAQNAQRLVAQLTDYLRRIDQEFARLTLRGEKVHDFASISAGGTATTTITVPTARRGDSVRVFPPVDLQGLGVSGYVSADDTVTIVLINPTGGPIDLASATWRVAVERY